MKDLQTEEIHFTYHFYKNLLVMKLEFSWWELRNKKDYFQFKANIRICKL